MQLSKATLAIAVYAASMLISVGSAAQYRDDQLVIEEIIVTAQKREQNVQEVPIAITALTTELKQASIRNLTDLNAYLPNVVIGDSSARSRSSSILIRGISYSETDKSFDSPIAVNLDGVYIGTSSGQIIENFDVERVEVLRGPQGTLFGKNTVGGVISVIRTRPTGELGGDFQLTYGDWDTREFRGVLNLPQVGDMLSTKLFYNVAKSDGHMKNTTTNRDGPERDYTNYGVSLLLAPNDRFDALLTVETYDDGSDVGAWNNLNDESDLICILDPLLPANTCQATDTGSGDTYYSSNTHNPGQYDTDAVTLNMSFEINNQLRLVSVTGWRDEDEETNWDFDGTAFPFIDVQAINTFEQLSQEIRLEGTYEKVSFVAGTYYWESEYDQNWVTFDLWQYLVPELINNGELIVDEVPTGIGTYDLCYAVGLDALFCDQAVPPSGIIGVGGLGPNFVQKLYQKQQVDSLAFFFQADYQLAEKWTLTAGIRYTDEKKEFDGAKSYLTTLERAYIDNYEEIGNFDDDWQEWTPKVAVAYQYSDDIMFYASYSEGFHSGGFFGRNQKVEDFANTYDPEYANTYELGMKSQWLNNRLQFNLAAFYNDFEDKQVSTIKLDESTQSVVTVIDNVASVDYLGLEAELRAIVTPNLNMFATLGLLDAEYNEFDADLVGNGIVTDNSGYDVTFAPEVTAGVGGTYSLQVGPGELALNARYNYIDEMESITTNDPSGHIDDQHRVDASLDYLLDRYRITVFGRNLTDEIVVPAINIAGLFTFGSPSPGRFWGIEVQAKLGTR